jgi:hypothetical protein
MVEMLSTKNLKIDDAGTVMQIAGVPTVQPVVPELLDRHGSPIHRCSIPVIVDGKEVIFDSPMHVLSQLTYPLYRKYLPASYFENMTMMTGEAIRMGIVGYRETDIQKKQIIDAVYKKASEEKIQFTIKKILQKLTDSVSLPQYSVQIENNDE